MLGHGRWGMSEIPSLRIPEPSISCGLEESAPRSSISCTVSDTALGTQQGLQDRAGFE